MEMISGPRRVEQKAPMSVFWGVAHEFSAIVTRLFPRQIVESNALLSLSANRPRRLVTSRGELRWSRRHRGVCLGVDVVGYDKESARSGGEQCSLVSLDQPTAKAGYMVKSLRFTPTNSVGQARERVSLMWLPREACFDQERRQNGERHSDTQFEGSRRHLRACLGVAEFGVRSVDATETMSATVKHERETEELASCPVGYGMVSRTACFQN